MAYNINKLLYPFLGGLKLQNIAYPQKQKTKTTKKAKQKVVLSP